MVRSMVAGVSGLRTHQSKLDVIGNNIANVNTWGFKSSSFNFTDAMYSTSIAGASGSVLAVAPVERMHHKLVMVLVQVRFRHHWTRCNVTIWKQFGLYD